MFNMNKVGLDLILDVDFSFEKRYEKRRFFIFLKDTTKIKINI